MLVIENLILHRLFAICRGRRPRRPTHTDYVTFVKRYKSNQKNFGAWCTPLTADDNQSAQQTEQKSFVLLPQRLSRSVQTFNVRVVACGTSLG